MNIFFKFTVESKIFGSSELLYPLIGEDFFSILDQRKDKRKHSKYYSGLVKRKETDPKNRFIREYTHYPHDTITEKINDPELAEILSKLEDFEYFKELFKNLRSFLIENTDSLSKEDHVYFTHFFVKFSTYTKIRYIYLRSSYDEIILPVTPTINESCLEDFLSNFTTSVVTKELVSSIRDRINNLQIEKNLEQINFFGQSLFERLFSEDCSYLAIKNIFVKAEYSTFSVSEALNWVVQKDPTTFKISLANIWEGNDFERNKTKLTSISNILELAPDEFLYLQNSADKEKTSYFSFFRNLLFPNLSNNLADKLLRIIHPNKAINEEIVKIFKNVRTKITMQNEILKMFRSGILFDFYRAEDREYFISVMKIYNEIAISTIDVDFALRLFFEGYFQRFKYATNLWLNLNREHYATLDQTKFTKPAVIDRKILTEEIIDKLNRASPFGGEVCEKIHKFVEQTDVANNYENDKSTPYSYEHCKVELSRVKFP